jgi:hypothetical protein
MWSQKHDDCGLSHLVLWVATGTGVSGLLVTGDGVGVVDPTGSGFTTVVFVRWAKAGGTNINTIDIPNRTVDINPRRGHRTQFMAFPPAIERLVDYLVLEHSGHRSTTPHIAANFRVEQLTSPDGSFPGGESAPPQSFLTVFGSVPV